MNKQEYADYQVAVKEFFDREGINRLYTGHSECPECKVKFDDHDRCPKCGTHVDTWNEPFFSWQPCDCCGDSQGGNREHATSYNPTTKGNQEYTICEDCVYYAEYGRLDDTTMDEIEKEP